MLKSLRLMCAVAAFAPVAQATTTPAVPPTAVQVAASDPRAAWAISFLMNTAMLAELDAVHAATDAASRPTVLASPAGIALLARARFAAAAAKGKSQMVPELAGLELPKDGAKPDAAGLAASFTDDARRQAWTELGAMYAAPMPTCPLTSDEVKGYADHQAKVLAGGDGSTGVSVQALMAKIASWNPDKRRCLALVLMGMLPKVKEEPGYEPLHLLAALGATGMSNDLALRALLATRYLQLGQYPESLRALVELTDVDPAFRLPYELVQRVFGLRQRGPGAVALQGL